MAAGKDFNSQPIYHSWSPKGRENKWQSSVNAYIFRNNSETVDNFVDKLKADVNDYNVRKLIYSVNSCLRR